MEKPGVRSQLDLGTCVCHGVKGEQGSLWAGGGRWFSFITSDSAGASKNQIKGNLFGRLFYIRSCLGDERGDLFLLLY